MFRLTSLFHIHLFFYKSKVCLIVVFCVTHDTHLFPVARNPYHVLLGIRCVAINAKIRSSENPKIRKTDDFTTHSFSHFIFTVTSISPLQ